ncbi:MAG: hypothetical protein HEQ23_14580 [Tepidisphaera sp.]
MLVTLALVSSMVLLDTPAAPDPEQRAAAIEDLGSSDKSRVTKALFYSLDASDPDDRKALEQALDSPSYQRRQLAMTMLCHDEKKPGKRLIEVCFEGLSDDAIPIDTLRPMNERFIAPVGNANEAARFLIEHAQEVRPQLEKGLKDGDWQKKLLCAYIAGRAKISALLPAAAPVLINHLKDNDIRGDGQTAIGGLAGFGTDVLPYLERIQNPDSQQQIAVRLIGWHLDEHKRLHAEVAKLPKHERDLADQLSSGLYNDWPKLKWKLKDFDETKHVYSRPTEAGNDNPPSPHPSPRPEQPSDNEKDRAR